jgi:hypothetical protein
MSRTNKITMVGNTVALTLILQRALDGDGDAERFLRELLGRGWRRFVEPVALDCDAG